jgi:hypothetical protein
MSLGGLAPPVPAIQDYLSAKYSRGEPPGPPCASRKPHTLPASPLTAAPAGPRQATHTAPPAAGDVLFLAACGNSGNSSLTVPAAYDAVI